MFLRVLVQDKSGDHLVGFVQLFLIISALILVGVSEEFAHAAACIQKGKPEQVRNLRVSNWCLGPKSKVMVESFGVHFQGTMSYKDLLHITAAGPLFSLLTGGVFFCILWVGGINQPQSNSLNFGISVFLLLLPVLSLMPFSLAFPSDGSRILEIKRRCHLKPDELLKEMAQGVILVLHFLMGVNENGRKSIIKLKPTKILFLGTSILLALDQLTKCLIQSYLTVGETYIPKVKGIIGITYKINRSLMLNWGKLNNMSLIIFLHFLALVVVIWAYQYFNRRLQPTWSRELSFSFVFAFMLGNLIDRLCFGYVRDFITWFGPGAFNLADLYWYIGVGILVIEFVRQERKGVAAPNAPK